MGVLFSSPQVEFEIIRDKWLEGVAGKIGRPRLPKRALIKCLKSSTQRNKDMTLNN